MYLFIFRGVGFGVLRRGGRFLARRGRYLRGRGDVIRLMYILFSLFVFRIFSGRELMG